MNIPFSPPDINQEDIDEVVNALRSGWITTGPRTKEFEKQIAEKNLDVAVDITGCVGTCYLEPIVDIYEDNGELTRYVQIQPERVAEIVENHLEKGQAVESLAISKEDQQFIEKQQRVVQRNCG